MSSTAQKQDLGDPEVISAFATLVRDERTLTALYILTVADIRGTSPTVWNAWKGKLLEDLFRHARRVLRGETDYHFIAVEPASCPSFTRGKFAYDFCDTGMVTPLAKMYTLGSGFIPAPNHAGGLRYHGMSSILSQLYHDGLMEARAVEQTSVFEAAEYFAKTEGILPAPESSHAIKVAIDEAVKCRETGEAKNILFCLSGTGYFDMSAYEKYNDGRMTDYIPTDKDLEAGFAGIPNVNL
jgi:tryptophan synthase beta chain